MSQGGRGARLAQEALPRRRRATRLGRHLDHLERDLAMQHPVARSIGHAHRAAPQFPKRAVVAPLDLEIAED